MLASAREGKMSMIHYLFVSECDYLFSIHELDTAFRYDIRYENGDKILKAMDLPSELLEQNDSADGYEWFRLVRPYIAH